MQLFIDTNILLSFYGLNKEDLEELNKLADRVSNQEVHLLITDQIINEFSRNREQRIEAALKSFYNQTFNPQLPQICEEYPEADRLRLALKDYEKSHSVLISQITIDIKAKNLLADRIVRSFFEQGTKVPMSELIVERAKLRMSLGNPPGKNNSLGDAVNWECLLATVSDGEDLFLISGDKDYSSPLGDEELSGFLQEEWQRQKHSKIRFYRRLSSFFKEQLPEIEMANARDRDFLVRELNSCQSLTDVQKVVTRLSTYPEFTAGQANAIAAAVLNNPRVAWSIEDDLVYSFLQNTISRYEQYLDVEVLDRLRGLLIKSI
jgi:predicted nucleic acid-binding protein